jgi:hypothetical protein
MNNSEATDAIMYQPATGLGENRLSFIAFLPSAQRP